MLSWRVKLTLTRIKWKMIRKRKKIFKNKLKTFREILYLRAINKNQAVLPKRVMYSLKSLNSKT
jgi:hypothetical protein